MEEKAKEMNLPCVKPANQTEFTCRICFESESDSNPLISPCKCSGSMKYIHEECLKIWLLSQDKDLSASECDICKSKFQMRIELFTKCSCKHIWGECIGMFIFPVLLSLMLAILMVILLFLIQGIQSGKASAGEQVYLILLILACLIISCIILVMFIRTIRKGCCSSEMKSWRIESVFHEEVIEETIEQSNQTQHIEDVTVMVIPKFSRLNGRNIIRPEFASPRLIPIVRGTEVIGYQSRPVTNRSANSSHFLNPESIASESNKGSPGKNFKIWPEPK